LQAAKESGADRIIVTSTSEVYGTARYAPIDEGHPLQAQSPYSASKIGADKIAESFHLSFGLPAVIARPFNTYGPRQSARAIIPTVISQALSGSGRIKLGNLKPTRDMNYVADVCDGFVSIAGSEKVIGKTVNICSGGEISMRDLAETILQLTGSEAVIIEERRRFRPEDSEVDRLVGSNSNIHRLTGWRPRYALRDGLEKTIEWFRDGKNLNAYKGGMYNV
jgi:nucleoside-diphosphate-sugar epimerase